jgi:protein-disulfide isomerase
MDDTTQQENTRATVSKNNKNTMSNSLTIPISIVLGFGLIAAAIFFGGNQNVPGEPSANTAPNNQQALTPQGPVRPVDDTDNIRGNPNAPIVMIEYSDYECPFCKNFHDTMNKVMENYGKDGKVAWVYRQFPLEQLHPSAPRIAQAAECVADIGGNEAFWKFSDLVFGERETNEPTNISRLPEFAESAGVSEAEFNACLEDGRTKAAVEADIADGINAGGQGTPHTLVLVGGQQGVISGAQPYETVSQILDTLIAQLEETPEVR